MWKTVKLQQDFCVVGHWTTKSPLRIVIVVPEEMNTRDGGLSPIQHNRWHGRGFLPSLLLPSCDPWEKQTIKQSLGLRKSYLGKLMCNDR